MFIFVRKLILCSNSKGDAACDQPIGGGRGDLFAGGIPWIINDGWGPGGLSGHTRDMTSIERVGFFHFGSDRKDDPVGSLEAKIAECAAHQTGNSLMVLPEAFNVRGGFYATDPALDLDAFSRLQALSVRHGITFVAGIIDRLGGSNLACLIDGNCPPVVLSRKQAGGRDCLYTPSSGDHTIAALLAGIGITALVCDDAGYAARAEADRARAARNVLCVPAYMTITDSAAIANLWADSITVILANGCASYPSVIRHEGREYRSTRYRLKNEIALCDL